MNKSDIRAEALANRRAMTPDEVAQRSQAIMGNLLKVQAFRYATTILSYISSRDNEPDTHALIALQLDEGKRVLAPVSERGGAMSWWPVTGLESLKPGLFDILEPPRGTGEAVIHFEQAVVVMPGVAFSPLGHRIGYGGGYFDRFLEGFSGASIALAFDLQIRRDVVPDPHDVPVDIIVTESTVYHALQQRSR